MNATSKRPLALLLSAAILGGPTPLFAGSPLVNRWTYLQSDGTAVANGDYISASAGAATFHSFFVEVPPSLSRLVIDIFDADLGDGATDTSGFRDLNRGGGFTSNVAYQVFRPDGTAMTTNFTTGDAAGPAGADNAWLTLFDSNTSLLSFLDQFGTNAYSNNDGDVNFAGNWTETNDDGSATGGDVRVTGGDLRLGNSTDGGFETVEREANLTANGFVDADLLYDVTTSGNLENGDTAIIEVSGNGGGSWTTVQTLANDVTTSINFNITAFVATNTRVRARITGGYAGGTEFLFLDNVRIRQRTASAPVNGHWEVRVNIGANADNIHGFGVRAHDGTSGAGGTELNVYYQPWNTYGVENGTSRTYTEYPYITSGCDFRFHGYDMDGFFSGSLAHSGFSQALGGSGNAVWAHTNVAGFTSVNDAVRYGIWTQTGIISSSGGPNNYGNVYITRTGVADPNPVVLGSRIADSFRVYFPTDGGVAPTKPYVTQQVRHKSGPNPPQVNVQSIQTVTVKVVNPTSRAIAFSTPTRIVTVNVPGGGVTYGGNGAVSQGTITANPGLGATGNVTWNPGTVAAGATALLAYDIRVQINPGGTANVTGTVASNGTTAIFLDETAGAAATSQYTFGPLCPITATTGLATPAVVAELTASAASSGAVVRFKTVSEAGTTGFRLIALDNGVRREVKTYIPGALSPAGGVYEILDRDARSANLTYLVEEIEAGGKTRTHGPFTVRVSGDAPVLPQSGSRSTPNATQLSPLAVPSSPSCPGTTSRLKIETTGAGLQVIDGSVLASELGVSARMLRTYLLGSAFSLTNLGREIPWTSDGARLYFHAEAIDSLFTTKNVYWLSVAKGQMMAATSVAPPSGATLPAFSDSVHVETDALAATVLPLDPASDYWFWDYLLAGDPSLGRKTFDVSVPAVSAGSASLDVLLHGATTSGHAGEHAVRVALNGVTLGDVVFEGISPKRASFPVAPGVLVAGTNRVELTSLLTPQGTASAVVYLDSFDVTYPRTFDANGAAQLAFWVDPAASRSVAVTGLSGGAVSLYDITNPAAPRRVTGATPSASGVSFSAALPSRTRFLAAAAPDVPASTRTRCDSGLATQDLSAEYVVITSDALREQAQELSAHRSGQGLSTRLVTFEDVADAFSFGIPDPASLRAFVSYARSSWKQKPRYVLLAGAGHYDYRNLRGFGANHVPPLMTGTPHGLFPADHLIVEGDRMLPRTSIGRLPARELKELGAAIAKIRSFESPATLAARQSAYILADDPDQGFDFGADAGRLAAVLPASVTPVTSALGPAPLATVRGDLFARLASGLGLLGYLGHGGLDRLAAEGILTSTDVPSLPNAAVSPVLTAYTCTINRFGIPGFASLGEGLVNRSGGGASAVVAPSGLSDHPEARMLGTILTRSVFSIPGVPLGDVVEGATDQFLEDGGSAELLRLLTIFGDPAMRLTPAALPSGSGTPGE